MKVVDFGAFVNFLGARDGLVHISELAPQRVGKVTDVVKVGDQVKVKVLGFDDRGKVKLSMRQVDQQTGEDLGDRRQRRSSAEAGAGQRSDRPDDLRPGRERMRRAPALHLAAGHRPSRRGGAGAGEHACRASRRAKALGCGWVEFDVRLTADGALVLCHDDRLDRTTDGSGRVSAHSLAAIRGFDAGAWFGPDLPASAVPTLDEALAPRGRARPRRQYRDQGRSRPRPRDRAAVAASSRAGSASRLPPVLVSSFLPRGARRDARRWRPHIPRGLLFRRRAARLAASRGSGSAARRSTPTIAGSAAGWSREIRDAGYPLLAYTVNDPARARHACSTGGSLPFSPTFPI